MTPWTEALPSGTALKQTPKHKRRYCRIDGCTRIVKSQGLCCRHGAKPKTCKIDGCTKQAQGNFDGMCKSHFKELKASESPMLDHPIVRSAGTKRKAGALKPPDPEGESVYASILPSSVGWTSEQNIVMPLVQHLKDGFVSSKPPAWHRNEERRARGLWPVQKLATQLEGWERELVWMEILLLTGCPEASFRHLARGWGRDKGFHMVITQFICGRRGDVQRKRREPSAATTINNNNNNDNSNSNDDAVTDQNPSVADIWDDACYGDPAYNESLAADLIEFAETAREDSTLAAFHDGGTALDAVIGQSGETMDHHHDHQSPVDVSEYDPTASDNDEFDD